MNKWWRIIDRFPTKLAAPAPWKKHTHTAVLDSRYDAAAAAVFYGRIDYCDCFIHGK